MGFFNHNKNKNNANQAPASTANPWDNLKNVPMAPETLSPAESHRRKIINYTTNGNFADDPVDQATEYEFYQQMGSRLHENFYGEEEKLLSHIKGNIDSNQFGPEWIAQEISQNPAKQYLYEQVCAQMGVPLNKNSDQVAGNAEALNSLVNTSANDFSLKTPIGFIQPRSTIMNYLNAQHRQGAINAADLQYYTNAMDELEHDIYGKQFEYFQSFEAIRQETPRRLGWAERIDLDNPPIVNETYDLEVAKRQKAQETLSHEQDPAYATSYNQGVALAQQILALKSQNPAFADALEKGFRETIKANSTPPQNATNSPYETTNRWF